MIHHYLTKYRNEKKCLIVESWIQINVFKWWFIFSDKKMEIK